MATKSKDIKNVHVFFSWQSDSPEETNTKAIRKALAASAKRIENKRGDCKIVNDEATRNTSGSPNISIKIMEKIDAAQIFVADITTITSARAKRACPNPNVVFELGYAVAQLGWDRIILLINTAYGKFPKDVPFDINQQRCSPYLLNLDAKQEDKENLTNLLISAIGAVIEKNPKTPIELRGLSEAEIKHRRDVESLTWLLSQIHIPTLQSHIGELPRVLSTKAIWFWESFHGVVTNHLFNLYDANLQESVAKLHRGWEVSLQFDYRYRETPNITRHIFSNPGDAPLTSAQQRDWDAIEHARILMQQGLSDLLTRVRSSYLEIDILKTNKTAWEDYKQETSG